ncbi:MAG TPA: hypothetical protein PK661_02620, partial [Syntrophorhabdaceae bacterium]|nr:hypothetical protein [Syntrophorhabdaceae bacterium]
TRKISFIESRPSMHLVMTTLIVMAIGVWLPYSPLAGYLNLVPLPGTFWVWIVFFLAFYVTLATFIKNWFFKRYGGD